MAHKESDIYNIIHLSRELLIRLPRRLRFRFWWILLGMFVAGGFETITLGTTALFISCVADPNTVMNSSYISRAYNITHADFLLQPKNLIIFFSILVIILVTIKNILRAVVTYASTFYSTSVATYLGEILFSGFLYLPYEWHLSRNSANLALAVFWRVHFGRIVDSILTVLSDSLMILLLLITLFIFEPVISIIVIGAVGGSAILIYQYARKQLDKTTKLSKDNQRDVNRDVTSAMHAIKDVKIYTKQDMLITEFSRKAYEGAKLDAKQQFLGFSPQWILETVGFVMLGLTICVMYFYVNSSSVRVIGILSLLAVTAWRVLPAINKILNRISIARISIPYASTGLNYFKEIIKENVIIKPVIKKQIQFNHSIKFENISFCYMGAASYALSNINCMILKGKTVGIIGRSGSGKSTLADILIGLISPTSGRIIIDETSLNMDYVVSWMQKVGYVPQSAFIYDGTIAENVAFGLKSTQIDREQVGRCCQMAAMDEFVNKLPKRIDTPIGERGVKLSGGQQQRIAIARALYNSPEMMIFDEATSSLDYKSERDIQQTIYGLKGKLTLIIIAHRLSTVEGCDEIIWIEDGSVRKIGRPEELLPEYRKQMGEESSAIVPENETC